MRDVKLMQGDCLELMSSIPDNSVDMILCGLPYGTTKNICVGRLVLSGVNK